MKLLCVTGLLLTTLVVACGGSQKAPESAAAEPAAAESAAAPESAPPTPEVDATAQGSETEAAPTGPECSKDDDCTVFTDCCSCKAVASSKPPLTPCESVCGESKCEVKGITIDNVACDAGRCVIKKK